MSLARICTLQSGTSRRLSIPQISSKYPTFLVLATYTSTYSATVTMEDKGFEPPMYLTSWFYRPLASPICIILQILGRYLPQKQESIFCVLPLHHISCTELILGVEPRPYFSHQILLKVLIFAVRFFKESKGIEPLDVLPPNVFKTFFL